jgi:glycerol uptake facilitator protein
MSPYVAEFLGTAILIILGNGVVANVVLAQTKGHGGGWIVITLGWGMAVFVGVFCTTKFSGAHLNPAVTLGVAAAGDFDWSKLPGYWAAQMIGGFLGALVVYFFYREHFHVTADAEAKRACFCTSPNIRALVTAFVCEVIGTFMLILPVLLMEKPGVQGGLGAVGALPVGLLVLAIGLSLGGTTGYAINPARDLAPRLAHALLPIPGKSTNDWSYAWIPVLGPLVGALLAVLVHLGLGRTG